MVYILQQGLLLEAVKASKFSEANFGLLPTKLGPKKVEKRCFTGQGFVFYHVSREVSTMVGKYGEKKEP